MKSFIKFSIIQSLKSKRKSDEKEEKWAKPFQSSKQEKFSIRPQRSTLNSTFAISTNIQKLSLQAPNCQSNSNNSKLKNSVDEKLSISSNSERSVRQQHRLVTPSGNSRIPRLLILRSSTKSGFS